MAGIHRLQHVECFFTATLTDNDPVRTHAQCVFDQFSLTDLSFSFDIWRPGFHAADMRLLKLKFGGILDGDQPLFMGNE